MDVGVKTSPGDLRVHDVDELTVQKSGMFKRQNEEYETTFTAIGCYALNVVMATVPVFVQKFKGMLLVPVLIQTLGLTGYGIWVQLFVIVRILGLLGSLGLHTAIVRFFPECKTRSDQKQLVSAVIAASVTASALIMIATWLLADLIALKLLGTSSLADIIRLSTLLIPLHALYLVFITIFRAQNNIRLFSFVRAFYEVVDFIVIVLITLLVPSVSTILAGSIIVLTLFVMTLGSILIRARLIGLVIVAGELKRCLKYSVPILPSQFSDEIAARGDRMLVGFFMGPRAVGIYSALYALSNLTVFFNAPVVDVLFPKMSHLWAERRIPEGLRYLNLSVISMAGISTMVLLGLVLLREPIWYLVTATELEPPIAGLLPVLFVLIGAGTIFFALSRVILLTVFVSKSTRWVPAVFGLSAIVNVIANLLLIPRYGLLGAAASTGIAYLGMLISAIWLSRNSVSSTLAESASQV
jgi:O-antigen/teichoic acid export membrane protein